MKTGLVRAYKPDLENVNLPDGLSFQDANFALNMLQGYTMTEAYKLTYGSKAHKLTNSQLSRAAYKVKTKPLVQQYMKTLVKELERAAVATALDIQMFLSAAIFTPISQIDENHPLCQKKKTRTVETKDGGSVESVELESVSKMDAVKTLIRMKSLDAPIKVDVNHNVGVMVVPMATNVDEWEKAAAKSQQSLMDDAIDV